MNKKCMYVCVVGLSLLTCVFVFVQVRPTADSISFVFCPRLFPVIKVPSVTLL